MCFRSATEADAAAVAVQRVKMFQDSHVTPVGTWAKLESDSATWTAAKLREGSYAGWIIGVPQARAAPAVLHASAMGKPIYEALGWTNSNEMLLRL